MIYILITILLISIANLLYFKLNPQFGGRINATEAAKLQASPQWQNGKFQNAIETKMNIKAKDVPKLLKEQFFPIKDKVPSVNLNIAAFDKNKWNSQSDKAKFIWYGHSVLLLQIDGKNILIDPMFGSNAAPIAPFAVKRFTKDSLQIIKNLPEIDLVLLTHDHYDHLDYESIKLLKPKVKEYKVAIGVARHLVRWGIQKSTIQEFDWWDECTWNNIQLTFTPSRHFSGRGTVDRAKSLWGGWSIIGSYDRIYWSGDSGYGPHFKEVGEKLGPFDITFIECGQYNPMWHAIHMYPEEAVQAAIDAQASIAVPVHWAGFALALHSWKEPIERFSQAAVEMNQRICIPPLGSLVQLNEMDKVENYWWKTIQ